MTLRSLALAGTAGLARTAAFAFTAALLAGLLGPVAGPLPATRASAAATDLTLVGDATYAVVPDQKRVHVVVDFTVRNHTSESRTRKFYFDKATIAVLPGTRAFHVTGWPGSKVRVTRKTASYTMLRIDFGSRLYSGRAHPLRLAFDLPDPGRSHGGQVRIGPSLVTFPVWAFASDGARGSTVAVRFPTGYDVKVESGAFDRRSTAPGGGTVLQTGPLASPLAFFAFVSGQRPAVYRETPLAVPAGPESIALTLRSWQDDPGWQARMKPLLKGALPVLRRGIGVPWPYQEPLVVEEAVSRSADGYAGLFDAGEGRIEVAYWAAPLVVIHEAAHGWFNGGLLADRWASEGFASLYAGRAARQLKVKGVAPALTKRIAKAKVPLNAWASDGSDEGAVEAYGYAASLTLAKAIAKRAGDPALQRVWADARDRVGAYQPGGTRDLTPGGPEPETVDGPPDWRGLLDLLDAHTGRDFSDLWRTWVVRDDEVALLDARDEARTSYSRTLALANGWVLPRPIRDALRAWQFGTAEQLMADARTVLAQRAALEQVAARDGLVLPSAMRGLFEAGSMTGASAEAEAERNAMLAIDEARASLAANTDPLSSLGMIGEQPEADLQAARDAFAAGDLDTTFQAADDAYRAWNGAWQEGRRRALLALAVLATIVVLSVGGRPPPPAHPSCPRAAAVRGGRAGGDARGRRRRAGARHRVAGRRPRDAVAGRPRRARRPGGRRRRDRHRRTLRRGSGPRGDPRHGRRDRGQPQAQRRERQHDHPLLLRRGQPRRPAGGDALPRDAGRDGDQGQGVRPRRVPPGDRSLPPRHLLQGEGLGPPHLRPAGRQAAVCERRAGREGLRYLHRLGLR